MRAVKKLDRCNKAAAASHKWRQAAAFFCFILGLRLYSRL